MLKELVEKSRSKRSFVSGEAIPRELLLDWVDTARKCPAARNLQPLKYKIISTPEECARIQPLTFWATSLQIKLPPRDKEPTAFIVICHDTDIAPEAPIFMIDVGIAAQTIMLRAAEDGFGGCMIGSARSETVYEALGLEKNLVPKLVLGLGRPDETVVLTDAENGNVSYYRDENNVHYAPKRKLEDIIIK